MAQQTRYIGKENYVFKEAFADLSSAARWWHSDRIRRRVLLVVTPSVNTVELDGHVLITTAELDVALQETCDDA